MLLVHLTSHIVCAYVMGNGHECIMSRDLASICSGHNDGTFNAGETMCTVSLALWELLHRGDHRETRDQDEKNTKIPVESYC